MIYSSKIFLGTLGVVSVGGISGGSYFLLKSKKDNKSIKQDYQWEILVKKGNNKWSYCKERTGRKVTITPSCFSERIKKFEEEWKEQKDFLWMRMTKNISKAQIEKVIVDWNKNDCRTKEKEEGWVELKCQKNKDNKNPFLIDW